MINEQEIRKAIELLKPENGLFEIRIIAGRYTTSGYFKDSDIAIAELKKARLGKNANVYITLNQIKNECFDRSQKNVLVENATPTTSDGDISGLCWLMVDIDPKRAAGTSSSDEQIVLSKNKTNAVYEYLRDCGWAEPLVAMSGNGVHLLYRVKLKNNSENVKLLCNCLLALNMRFADELIDVDLKTFNPARICKLYGTLSQKGSNTEERPHRMSKIVKSGSSETTDRSLLEKLADILPKEEKPAEYNNYNPRTFDLSDWIYKHGLNVREQSWTNGKKWIFDSCPFNSEHKGKDAAIIQLSNGAISFNCFHNSCSGNTWRELRMLYEPDAYNKIYERDYIKPNYKNTKYEPVAIEQKKDTSGKPVFYTINEIRALKAPDAEYIKTGIEEIDRRMRGLAKGFVSCMTGLRGSGKTSLISQISVEAADQGYRVALFSGELTPKNTYKWISLQAAGKQNVHGTQYQNYYRVNDDAEPEIAKWLNEHLFIYNNDYGNDFKKVHDHLNECVKKHKVDMIILDNLMALNINMLENDKYSQQSRFVQILKDFAIDANVHILFVAHPRKASGFLRLDDVGGSGDITNRVDNAFIVHRVNDDFKRLSKTMYHWSNEKDVYHADNVIEVAKDRFTGVQDLFITLYFCKESKRLKNYEHEHKAYQWEQGRFVEVSEIRLPFLDD